MPRCFLNDDEHNDDLLLALWLQMVTISVSFFERIHFGSTSGRSATIRREYEVTHIHYMKIFLFGIVRSARCKILKMQNNSRGHLKAISNGSTFFNSIYTGSVSRSEYLRKGIRWYCTGWILITPLIKVICKLRQLSYGIQSDLPDNLFDIADSTAAMFLEHFCSVVI